MRIALDAMGSDAGPAMVAEASHILSEERPQLELVLIGDRNLVESLTLPARVQWEQTAAWISNDEEPAWAVRHKTDASIVRAMHLLKTGRVDAVVTAGSTGATMVAALFIVGRLRGIQRPALTAILPGGKQGTMILDVGANADPKPQHLLQYGLMGEIYARELFRIAQPKVRLLNIGAEEEKGNQLAKEAYNLFKHSTIAFEGNIEGNQVLDGVCDVIVTDGFTGNVLTKGLEGMGHAMSRAIRTALTHDFRSKLGGLLARQALSSLTTQFSAEAYGGAPLLGVNGVVVKAHGSSNARTFANAVKQAERLVERGVLMAVAQRVVEGSSQVGQD